MAIPSLSQLNELSYCFHVPATGMTLQRFREWAESDDYPDRGRILYHRGEMYFDMSPERVDTHTALKEAINRTLGMLVYEGDLGRYYPDGITLVNLGADLSNEPDALFASWDTIRSGKLTIPPDKKGKHTELLGTPDWVCEIVSDSSVKKDTQLLRDAYHKAGIPEYWLIDARGTDIDFQLLVWNTEGYQPAHFKPGEPAAGWRWSPNFEREFQFTRYRDQVGWWQYDLKSRP